MDDNNMMMMMPMTFYGGEVIGSLLFSSWEVRTRSQYIGAVVVTLLLGVAFEFLRNIRPVVIKRLAKPKRCHLHSQEDELLLHPEHERKPPMLKIRLVDTLLMMIQLTCAYFLMLIAMVYNGGLFAAVIAGCGLGNFIFGTPIAPPKPAGDCH